MELLSVVSFAKVFLFRDQLASLSVVSYFCNSKKISCKDNSNCLIWKFELTKFDKVIFIAQKYGQSFGVKMAMVWGEII